MKNKIVYQLDEMDCGPSCLAMVAQHYGKEYKLPYLRENCHINKNGVNLLGISEAAEKIGFDTVMAKLTLNALANQSSFPCILHWNQNHFVVLHKIIQKRGENNNIFCLADPAHGYAKVKQENFIKSWTNNQNKGVALFLKPNDKFFELEPPKNKKGFQYLFKYAKPYKKQLVKIFASLLIGSLLTLIFPFTTQALVDRGIGLKDVSFITLILGAQLGIFFGHTFMEIIRDRLLLHIGTRINITILSDFLTKLFKMPLKYFDAKLSGDLLQRIDDHRKIEAFLTSQSIFTLFSLVNFSVFFIILAYYSWILLVLYLSLTLISVVWVLLLQRRREALDYEKFHIKAENQSTTLELVTGMQSIKLNSFESYKQKQWKDLQEKLFALQIRVLHLDQLQISGFKLFNSLKNILLSFLVARFVIKGGLTLGEMFSVSYIIGEMNAPINQLIEFLRSRQDAKLSFARMEEIHNQPELAPPNSNSDLTLLSPLSSHQEGLAIQIRNLNFQYGGPRSPMVLRNINLDIPSQKVTAIVGASGSGKTTLMKLLLKYYAPTKGNIFVHQKNLTDLNFEQWRTKFGVVMQDGFLFSETVERNIATSADIIDVQKLEYALRTANLTNFLKVMPNGLETRIGAAGNGVSGGQKQRILIARAIYKNPDFLFFDEATSALDAENEKVIIDNLNEFFHSRTVLIIAHRLSTVKNADQIVALKDGEVVEVGNHMNLVLKKGHYYNLIKNQLELGSVV